MAHWIIERFKQYHDSPALIIGEDIYCYADIIACYNYFNQTLCPQEGAVVYVKGNYSPYTLAALLWALDKNIIIIPLSLQSVHSQERYFDIIAPNIIIECADAKTRSEVSFCSDSAFHHCLTEQSEQQKKGHLILFSSGTTGVPKAAVHDFNLFLDKFRNVQKKIRTMGFLNIDHIGGLNTVFTVLSAGGVLAIPQSTQPDYVCEMIQRYQLELLPTTPSFLRMLLMSNALMRYKLSSLKTITYGTEFMPETNLVKLKALLPHVRLKQTYGSTEIGIIATKSKTDDSTWLSIDKSKVNYKIIDDMLWVKVSNRSLKGYLNATIKIENDWINTQDRVLQEGDYLKILGRDSELINVGGNKVDPHEIEEILLQCDEVADAVVYGKASPILGQVVISKVYPKKDVGEEKLKNKLTTVCAKTLEPYKRPAYFIIEPLVYSPRWKKLRE